MKCYICNFVINANIDCDNYISTTQCKCGMWYNFIANPWTLKSQNNEWKLFSFYKKIGKGIICWFENKHICSYPGGKSSIVLPWLPYTITEEKLKLYMVFS